MQAIRILPPSLADKIAAGEVVERPASVVKELIENALDAGADQIRADILGAGRRLIQVSDNGCGMSREDAELSILRHATSKIKTEADLFRIATLGFRGEALPSIAAVSHLTLETKPKSQQIWEGTLLEVRGGEVLQIREAGCPAGTRVKVEELFYNTPARLKFLKSDGVETGAIEDTVLNLALGNWNSGFELYVEAKEKLSSPPAKDPLKRLEICFGGEFVADLLEVREIHPDLELQGWVVHPRQSAGNTHSIRFYLNGRFLKDKVLNHALGSAYDDFLMKGRYPKAVLYLKLSPEEVDVNVHPSKREVRFKKPQIIHQFVTSAVKKALQKKIYGSGGALEKPPFETVKGSVTEAGQILHWEDRSRSKGPIDPAPAKTAPSFKKLKVLGAFASAYILCEDSEKKLVLIDQHAAHERIGFEKLKKNLGTGKLKSQSLSVPVTFEANPRQAALLKDTLGVLNEAGLEVEPFGGNTFVVKTLPVLISAKEIPGLLEKFIEELDLLGESLKPQKMVEHVLKTIACHSQVRAGDKLSPEEMNHLLKEMDQFHAASCPHGRPTFVEIASDQIEKWFKRS